MGNEYPQQSRSVVPSTLYLNSALDGAWLPRPRPGRFTPGIETRYPFYRRVGGPQDRSGRERKISTPPGFDLRTVQHEASRYTVRAIPAHVKEINKQDKELKRETQKEGRKKGTERNAERVTRS